MLRDQYADASVLLFDAKHNIRRQTRSVLNSIGFWGIVDSDSVEDCAQAIQASRYDLIILATDRPGDGVISLVRAIRRGRCGADPFVPIILTSWNASMKHVKAVVDSGADDLLIHPFSTAQILERVRVLINGRKPFVMTEDYMGPDRRRTAERTVDASVVEVPNALQAAIEGRSDLAPSAALIAQAMAKLERVKVRNMAHRIYWIAEDLNSKFGTPDFEGYMEKQLGLLLKVGESYSRSLQGDEAPHLGQLCNAVTKVASGLQGKPISQSSLELLEETALALRVSSEIEEDTSDEAQQITAEVARLSSRGKNAQPDEDWDEDAAGSGTAARA